MKPKLFRRDFTLVVIGQIISLFGNAVLRFALPLYLLNETRSPALFGVVSACSFIPIIVLSPIGGVVADRVNKRNIMVALDFFTAALILVFSLLLGKVGLVPLLLVTLMLLFGIQGAYQPSVQASLPALVPPEQLIPANAVINQVSSLAGLVGPVAGGALYSFWGLRPILAVSGVCFLVSAIMEIFIHIPFERRTADCGVLQIVRQDLTESLSFVRNEQPAIAKVMGVIVSVNLFISALIVVGMPVMITQQMALPEGLADLLYGYAQGFLGLGGLVGGLLTGLLAKKLRISNVHLLLLGAAAVFLPIGLAFMLNAPVMVTYFVLVACLFVTMALSTIVSVQMLAFIQSVTPAHMVGKVVSCLIALSICAQPLGQLLYGFLFDLLPNSTHLILFFGAAAALITALFSKTAFGRLKPNAVLPEEQAP